MKLASQDRDGKSLAHLFLQVTCSSVALAVVMLNHAASGSSLEMWNKSMHLSEAREFSFLNLKKGSLLIPLLAKMKRNR